MDLLGLAEAKEGNPLHHFLSLLTQALVLMALLLLFVRHPQLPDMTPGLKPDKTSPW